MFLSNNHKRGRYAILPQAVAVCWLGLNCIDLFLDKEKAPAAV